MLDKSHHLVSGTILIVLQNEEHRAILIPLVQYINMINNDSILPNLPL